MDKGIKKFLSWNVNGIRAIEKKGLIEIIQELGPDIIGLQEIKAQPDQLSDGLKSIPGYTAFWHAAERKGYAGVGIYSKMKPLNILVGIDNKEHDREGRVLTLEFNDFYFINAYFPNAQHGLVRLDYKLDFNNDFLDFANQLAHKKSVVICGDFNVAHKPIDLKNPQQNENNAGFSAPERVWMDKFINNGYVDTFRKFTADPGHYTWWSYRFNARAKDIGWRIDYFCVDKKSEGRVAGAGILKEVMGSDHCPVSLDFK
jgi:exodeoxyribonuclease-3